MKRVISLYLPTWPTDRARWRLGHKAPPSDEPLICHRRIGPRQIVTAVDAKALKLGLAVDMPLTKAMAMIAGLHMEKADDEGDLDGLTQLAEWGTQRYSPVVGIDPPDGLLIDATGVGHLFGGEQAMFEKIISELHNVDVFARAVLSTTYGAAYSLARHHTKQTQIVEAERRDLLRDLPVEGLRLSEACVGELHALGFDTVGELVDAPSASLALRFGSEIRLRLDQMFGHVPEPIDPVIPPETIHAVRPYAEPISTPEALKHGTTLLVEELSGSLESKDVGARKLDLLFHRIDHRIEAIRIGLAKPDRDVKRICRLLIEKLTNIDPGLGVERMSLIAPWCEPLHLQQVEHGFATKIRPEVSGMVDTLVNRFGERNVYRQRLTESRVPERSVCSSSPLKQSSSSAIELSLRPTRILARPEPIQTIAMLPDRPPVAMTWRGQHRRIHRADGPERIFGEWWKKDAERDAVRDYFRVEDEDGRRFWVYRSGDGRDPATGSGQWFLHGFFG